MFNLGEENRPETANGNERRRTLLIFGALAAIILGLLILLFAGSQESRDSDIAGMQGAGSNEFESYRERIQIEMIETIVHPNLVGMAQHEVRARLTNHGDKTLTAIGVRGRMLGLDDSTVAETVGYPVPRFRADPLPPGESLDFSIKIDRPGNVGEELVKDHALELNGLRFQ